MENRVENQNGVNKSSWAVFTCIVELLHNKCNKCSPSGETALLHISTLSINMSVVNGIERHQVMPITCWWHEGSNLINAHLPVHCWALNVSPSFSHLCHFFPLGSCFFTLQYMYIKIYFPGFSLIINVHVCLQETMFICRLVACLPIHSTLSLITTFTHCLLLFHRLSKLWKTTTAILSMPLWWVFCAAVKYL